MRRSLQVIFPAARLPDSLIYRVDNLSRAAVGGCDRAVIRVFAPHADRQRAGALAAIEALINLLNHEVRIVNQHNDLRWWGRVNEVVITHGAVSFGLSLERMANRIAVAFSDYSGRRRTTDWAQNRASMYQFGRKELLLTLNDASWDAAIAHRDKRLEELARPLGVALFDRGQRDALYAEIICEGYWKRLHWTYYSYSGGVHEHTIGSSEQNLGEGSGIDRIAQGIYPPESSTAFTHLTLALRKQASPSDNVIAEIRTGPTFGAGTLIATATFAPASIQQQVMQEITAPLSNPWTPDGTQHHIIIRRAGANDPTLFYMVGVDPSKQYLGGTYPTLSIRVGGNWLPGIPNDAHLQFRLTGQEQTTTQIRRMALTHELITGVDVESPSTVNTIPFRAGDTRLGEEIENLLDMSARNGRRLIAEITPERRMRIYQETDARYYIGPDGVLRDVTMTPVDLSLAPVGCAVVMHDVFPSIERSSVYARAIESIIDRAEYSARYDDDGNLLDETLRMQPKDADDLFSVRLEAG